MQSFIIIIIIYFIFLLLWVFIASRGLSLVAASGGHSLVVVNGLLIAATSLVTEHGFWSVGSVVSAHGFVAPQHVESSWTGDRIHVPCTGRQIPNLWTTREVPPTQSYP